MKDLRMMLLKPDPEPLSNVNMLGHADDAGDVRMFGMADEIVVDDVCRCPRWVLHEAQYVRWRSHDDAVEKPPMLMLAAPEGGCLMAPVRCSWPSCCTCFTLLNLMEPR